MQYSRSNRRNVSLDFSFSKQNRIRKGRDYARLKRAGHVFKTKLFVFNFIESDKMRLGLIVTKKVGNSVVRNRIKRWIREVFRLEKGVFTQPLDIVIIPRQSNFGFNETKRDFLYFAEKNGEKFSNISCKTL